MQDMDVVDDFEDGPGAPRRAGGFLGKFIAVLLGLIIGILAGAGGFAGILYALIAKTKIKTNMNTVNSFIGTNINYADFINGKYGEKTIIDFAGDTITAINQVAKGDGTLNTLNEISPLIGKTMVGEDGKSGVVGFLNGFYLNLVPEEVMNRVLVKPAGATKNPDKYLMDYITEKMNGVPVADFLIKMGYPLNDTLLAIACGIEGTEFIKNPDGTITMLNGKKQLTLGEFLGSDLEKAIYRLPIDAIMPISLTDKVMMMLSYGEEYCYEIVGEKVVMNQVFYTYNKTEGKLFNGRGAEIDPATIKNADFANGKCEIQIDESTVEYLKATDTSGETFTLYAYSNAERSDNNKVFYKKTTINDLKSGAVSLVEDMYLKDVLNIGLGDGENHDRMLISLAYGVKDVDYKIVTENGKDKIVSINPPRTIGDLRDHGEDLIHEIYLYDIIDTDTHDKVTMYILYGKENLHYSVDGETVTMLQKQVAVAGDKVYGEYGDVFIGTLTDGKFTDTKGDEDPTNDVTYILGEKASNSTIQTIDNTEATMHYVLDESGKPVNFPYISLGDLKGDSPILENMTTRLTLGDVLSDDAFKGHNVLIQLKDTKIKDLPTRMSNLTVGEVYGENPENIFLNVLKDTPLETLSDKLDVLTVGEIFGEWDPDTETYVIPNNPLLNALASTNINKLEDKAYNLKIKEIIPDSNENQILKHLQDSTFTTLSSDVEKLTFNQVFGNEIWKDASTADNVNSFVGIDDNEGYAVDSEGNRIFLNNIWKYMLYKDINDPESMEDYHVVSQQNEEEPEDPDAPSEPRYDINDMLDNVVVNMKKATLEMLISDGMIKFDSDEDRDNFLSSKVLEDPTDLNSERVALKDMTIIDILNYVAGLGVTD